MYTHSIICFEKAFFNESFVAMPGAPPHDGDPQDQHSLRDEDVAKNSGIHEGKYTFSDGFHGN